MSAPPSHLVDYGPDLEPVLAGLEQMLRDAGAADRWPVRWLALGLVTGDPAVRERLATLPGGDALLAEAGRTVAGLGDGEEGGPALTVADRRWTWINEHAAAAVAVPDAGVTASERIDRVLTHRVFGLPILLGVLWLVFKIVTDVAGPFVDLFDGLVNGPIARAVAALLGALGLAGTWFEALVIDGLVAGVGAVAVFLPVLVVLFTALALLEDTGYLARAAFVMDRVLAAVGLPGKAFLPLLVGFGCNVPAVYATRLLESRRDRILTGLVAPYASCAARLPVYVLVAGAVFPSQGGTVVFLMYLVSLVAIIAAAGLLNLVAFRGEPLTPFLLELPAYRRPSATIVWRKVRRECGEFLARAGTVILVCAVAVWLLGAIPVKGDAPFGQVPADDSALAAVSGAVAPVFAPLGFDSWRVTAALVTGFVAKEVVIGTLGQVYGTHTSAEADEPAPTWGEEVRAAGASVGTAVQDALLAVPGIVGIRLVAEEGAEDVADLQAALGADLEETSGGHPRAAGAALMVFVLLYVPCMATVAAQRQEFGTRWMLTSMALSLVGAWLVGAAVFGVGRLVGG